MVAKQVKQTRKISARPQVIGIIALSSACEPSRFKQGIETLRSLGFGTKVALDPTKNYGKSTYLFSSASASDRARALETLFMDKEVSAIVAARGAYGSMEVLPARRSRAWKTPSLCAIPSTWGAT